MNVTEAVKVEVWVLDQFLRLGFTTEQAEDLTARGIDRPTAARMLAQGCTHELVVKILV